MIQNVERCFTENLLMQKCMFSWLSFRTFLDSHGAQDIRILGSGDHFLLKVNGYTFRGSNSDIFIFIFLSKGGQLLKKTICSSGSKFFPWRVGPFSKGFVIQKRKLEVMTVTSI